MPGSSQIPSAEPDLPVWAEVHFDDEVLSAQPARWPLARDLLLRLTALAEARGARLSLRFRLDFARLAAQHAPDLLPDLQRRGHEVGAHAHGRLLAETCDALRAAGILPTVAAPGLVQVGPGGRPLLLRQAAALGILTVTDHGAQRAWAYEGLLPRREAGLWLLSPTVRPFDWGLMDTDGTRHGLLPPAAARLRHLRDEAAPRQGAAWFGFTFHEHDLCPPDSLIPRPAALDALASLLDARVVPAARLVPADAHRSADGEAPIPARGPSDRRVRMARAIHAVSQRLPARPHLSAALRRPPQGRLTLPAPGGRTLVAERLGPAMPRALLVVSHAGPEGGRRLRFRPFGPVEEALLQQGWGIWLYDRAGTGDSPLAPSDRSPHPLTPGRAVHTTDWQLVLARARAEGVPVVALSWSSGVLPPLRAAAAGHRPDALIDAEGPADRWSLVPPDGNELAALDPWDDAVWQEREPVALLPALERPYVRLQGTQDHVHGELLHHAVRMVSAAQAAGLLVGPAQHRAGRLHAHPEALLEAADWALAEAMRRR